MDIFFTISLLRILNCSSEMPVTSALYRKELPLPKKGINDIAKIRIPIPPIHCVKLRQKCSDFGNTSIFSSVELPVVVNPHMLSKKASVKFGMAPLIRNGSVPNSTIANQVDVTVK